MLCDWFYSIIFPHLLFLTFYILKYFLLNPQYYVTKSALLYFFIFSMSSTSSILVSIAVVLTHCPFIAGPYIGGHKYKLTSLKLSIDVIQCSFSVSWCNVKLHRKTSFCLMSLSDDQSLAAHADWLCTFLKDLLRVTVDILVIITVLVTLFYHYQYFCFTFHWYNCYPIPFFFLFSCKSYCERLHNLRLVVVHVYVNFH